MLLPSMHLVLVGLSGSGKSTVGRLLAQVLDRRFVDTDSEVERASGRTIAELFTAGEAHFRSLEAAAVRSALSGPAAVVSLGGGALLYPATRIRCASHCMLWLDAAPETLAERVAPGGQAKGRPLLVSDPARRLTELYAQRRRLYAQAHLHQDASPSPESVLGATLDALGHYAPPLGRTRTVLTTAAPRRDSYDVLSGRGILRQLGREVRERLGCHRCFVVSDDAVWPLAGEILEESLADAGLTWHVLTVPSGEASKTISMADRLWSQLAEHGAERRDPLVAFGGGVVGDLAGFVAATYLRGVPFVQVPTTLLAQVDSSIGGKVAVNHPLAKNIIGAFKAPDLVLVDTALLASLPPEHVANGWAEVLKHGVILDGALFAHMAAEADALSDLAPDLTLAAVQRSLEIKAGVVEEDEFEQGPRMLLNYGHTLGHAIEAAGGYARYLHGQAVSLGMVAAGWMAVQLGYSGAEDLTRIECALRRLRLPTRAAHLEPEHVLTIMQRDKKVRQGHITWVLPRGIGAAIRTAEVPPDLPAQALTYLSTSPEGVDRRTAAQR